MMQEAARRQLPVTLLPVAGELLSSWIGRHAAFYAVPPLVMLRHCLPEARSLRAADLHLGDDQKIRLAKVFATEPAVVRRMTFTNVAQSSRRLIAVRPQQSCPNCNARRTEPGPTLRSQLVGWRLTCPICGGLSGMPTGASSPPLSGNIAMQLFGANSCSTTKPNVVSQLGHRLSKSLGFS